MAAILCAGFVYGFGAYETPCIRSSFPSRDNIIIIILDGSTIVGVRSSVSSSPLPMSPIERLGTRRRRNQPY